MPKGENNRKLSDADRAEIVRLYSTPLDDGTWLGTTSIARRFGVAVPTIARTLRIADVKRRSAKEAHSGGKACKPVKNLPVGEAPACKCGCGEDTAWNRRKNRWNAYVVGHYTQRLHQNPSWEGGSSFAPYTDDWIMVSRVIRHRDNYTCQRCGDARGRRGLLHVHHVDCDKQNNDPANLVTLCPPCHMTTHRELGSL